MSEPVLQGNRRRVTVRYTDEDGLPKNPTTNVLRVRNSAGTIDYETQYVEPDEGDDDTGTYFADVTFDVSGRWDIEAKATGDVVATVLDRIEVTPDLPAPE